MGGWGSQGYAGSREYAGLDGVCCRLGVQECVEC